MSADLLSETVQRAAGCAAEADASVAQALELYEQEGNVAAPARIRQTR